MEDKKQRRLDAESKMYRTFKELITPLGIVEFNYTDTQKQVPWPRIVAKTERCKLELIAKSQFFILNLSFDYDRREERHEFYTNRELTHFLYSFVDAEVPNVHKVKQTEELVRRFEALCRKELRNPNNLFVDRPNKDGFVGISYGDETYRFDDLPLILVSDTLKDAVKILKGIDKLLLKVDSLISKAQGD